MTFNDQMEQIAQEAPGFAGFFLAPDGQINVKLKGEGRTSAVKGPLARYLLRGSAPDANTERMLAGMKVVPAEYDFVELATWYRELTPVFGSHGITMTDIDEVENRIVIGVETAMLVGDVRRAQQRTSVPSEAVVIKVVPAVALEADLQGNVRPVAAGVRIDPAGTNACTLAFNVRLYNDAVQYDGQRYFVTASHCTPLIWGATGARIGQHDESASNWIGTEVADPAPFTNSQNSTCPPGYDCRHSDAALVRYDSGINWTFGKIPTVGSTAPYSITGFKEIYNEDGYIDPSMGDNEPYYNGQSISKTGQATGKTAGIISSTYVDLAYPVGALDPLPVLWDLSFSGRRQRRPSVQNACAIVTDQPSSGGSLGCDRGRAWVDPKSIFTVLLRRP
jgi:hypothetical protein